MDLQLAATWAAMCLNRARRAEVMELEAELAALIAQWLESEAGQSQEEAE
jgi:hypothetical protein